MLIHEKKVFGSFSVIGKYWASVIYDIQIAGKLNYKTIQLEN